MIKLVVKPVFNEPTEFLSKAVDSYENIFLMGALNLNTLTQTNSNI